MSNGDRSYGPYGEKILAQKFKDTNKDFLGPYHEYQFNGKEADIILYIKSANSLYIQSMARARRLLIVVTNSGNIGFPRRYFNDTVKIMYKAVKNELVKKVSVDNVSLNTKQQYWKCF